ncbi:MAG TPA: IclR family transcriptional regulator [Nitriliruptoraceae bacterium]|nr:IclR family transcriptional regulator [Nitriliruptoraceae bacterium]
MAATPRSDSSGLVQSVDRAAQLLGILADVGVGRVTDLAERIQTHKSTVSRLLATLEAHGLVAQDPDTAAYRLGQGVVRLAGAVPHAFDLGAASRPIAVQLARQVRETVNLVVLDGTHTMCVDQVLGNASVTTVNWLGKRSPTHLAASGKALLAAMDPVDLSSHLCDPLGGPTPASITDRSILDAHLRLVRERGWADSIDEQEAGLTSVAASIRDRDGTVVAALAVSGPSFRMSGEHLERIGRTTAAAAARISRHTGQARTAGDA